MTFHLYDIDEIYSSADGTVQFIELSVGNSFGESFWQGQKITVTQGAVTHTFTFPADLPSSSTNNTHVLIATQGFADLGIVTPNYIVPNGFLFTSGDAVTVNYASQDRVAYTGIPTDGHSLTFTAGGSQVQGRTGTSDTPSPTNFAGVTGQLPAASSTVNGTEGNDSLTGTAGSDTINGLGGNDTLAGAGGQDTLNGGNGIDTAAVNATAASATTLSGSHVAAPGLDLTLSSVERVSFTDKLVVFDTQSGDAAWQAMALLTAGFGAGEALNRLDLWLGSTHQGASMGALAQQMIDFYAPGVGNAALVTYLYGSIAGISPSAADVDQFANDVGAGKTFATQGDLLAFAASLSLNTDHMVGFVGSVPQLDHVAGGG
jgi:serralysin